MRQRTVQQTQDRLAGTVHGVPAPTSLDTVDMPPSAATTPVLDGIRPTLRNAIAHLDLDATILIEDRWADLSKVEQVLPALRWIARQLLDAELQSH